MKNLEIIANALGFQIIAYRGFYELDKIDGSQGFHCNTLEDVAAKIALLIERKNLPIRQQIAEGWL